MFKKLGIIGGMGPEATVYLFSKIIELTHASIDQEHIPIIIDNNTQIPDRTGYIVNQGESPLEELLKTAVRLQKMGSEILAMPCNTAHYFYSEINEVIDIPFINMIEISVDYIHRNFGGNIDVGLLATEGVYASGIYDKACKKYSIKIIKPDEGQEKSLMEIIYAIKRGSKTDFSDILLKILKEYKNKGIEVIILGCTELPILFSKLIFNEEIKFLNQEYIDTTELLAKAIIDQVKLK
jgi:aspartate racemase